MSDWNEETIWKHISVHRELEERILDAGREYALRLGWSKEEAEALDTVSWENSQCTRFSSQGHLGRGLDHGRIYLLGSIGNRYDDDYAEGVSLYLPIACLYTDDWSEPLRKVREEKEARERAEREAQEARERAHAAQTEALREERDLADYARLKAKYEGVG